MVPCFRYYFVYN